MPLLEDTHTDTDAHIDAVPPPAWTPESFRAFLADMGAMHEELVEAFAVAAPPLCASVRLRCWEEGREAELRRDLAALVAAEEGILQALIPMDDLAPRFSSLSRRIQERGTTPPPFDIPVKVPAAIPEPALEPDPPATEVWTEAALLPIVAIAEEGQQRLRGLQEDLACHLGWPVIALEQLREGRPGKAAEYMRAFYQDAFSGEALEQLREVYAWFNSCTEPYNQLLIAVEKVLPDEEVEAAFEREAEAPSFVAEPLTPTPEPVQAKAAHRATAITQLIQAALLAAQPMEDGEVVYVPDALQEAAQGARAWAAGMREVVLSVVGAALDLQEGPCFQELVRCYTLEQLREMKRLALDLHDACRQSEAAVLAWLEARGFEVPAEVEP